MGITGRLIHSADVKRSVRASDSQGGYTITTTVVASSTACRVSLKSADERMRAEKEESLGDYKIFTLTNANIQVGDTLTVSSRDYEIIAIGRPSRGNHLEWEASLIESRG